MIGLGPALAAWAAMQIFILLCVAGVFGGAVVGLLDRPRRSLPPQARARQGPPSLEGDA